MNGLRIKYCDLLWTSSNNMNFWFSQPRRLLMSEQFHGLLSLRNLEVWALARIWGLFPLWDFRVYINSYLQVHFWQTPKPNMRPICGFPGHILMNGWTVAVSTNMGDRNCKFKNTMWSMWQMIGALGPIPCSALKAGNLMWRSGISALPFGASWGASIAWCNRCEHPRPKPVEEKQKSFSQSSWYASHFRCFSQGWSIQKCHKLHLGSTNCIPPKFGLPIAGNGSISKVSPLSSYLLKQSGLGETRQIGLVYLGGKIFEGPPNL